MVDTIRGGYIMYIANLVPNCFLEYNISFCYPSCQRTNYVRFNVFQMDVPDRTIFEYIEKNMYKITP